MGDVSKIEWLRGGHTASPWHGCSHVHTGCTNCYAETMAKRNPGVLGVWGPQGTRVRSKSFDQNCRKWQKQARAAGVRSCVFPSICDPFEDWRGVVLDSNGQVLHRGDAWGAPGSYVTPGVFLGKSAVRLDDLRADMFATIDACPMLDFLLLTKRPENVRRMWCSHANTDGLPPSKLYRHNVHLLYSASDQASLESGIDPLLACWDLGQAVGLSLEPLTGPIDLSGCIESLNWVIVGGESGANARPCHPDWIRSIRDQCIAAEVPFFFKQWGEWRPFGEASGWNMCGVDTTGRQFIDRDGTVSNEANYETNHPTIRVGKKAAGRQLDCCEWSQYPAEFTA